MTTKLTKEDWKKLKNKELLLIVFDTEKLKTFERMLGITPATTEGTLAEITSREAYNCKHKNLGELQFIRYEDGKKLQINTQDSLTATYIFKLESVDFPSQALPFLTGTAQEYNISNNTLGQELEKKVKLYFAKWPEYEDEAGLACL